MRFFRDRPDIVVPIRWYFVDRDDWLEYPTAFGSSNWDVIKRMDGCPVGELAEPKTWRDGSPPPTATSGPEPCGTPAQWRGEIYYADRLTQRCQCGPIIGNGSNGQNGQGAFNGMRVLRGLGCQCSTSTSKSVGYGCQCQHGQGELPGPPVVTTCPLANPVAEFWAFTMSGLSNDTCFDCATLNTSYVMSYVGACQWRTPEFSFCGSTYRWNFRGLSGVPNSWFLELFDVTAALTRRTYRIDDPAFDPVGDNELADQGGGGTCSNWPATVTISPTNGP